MPHGDDEDEYERTRMREVWSRTGSPNKTILFLQFMSLKVTAQSCKWVDLLFRCWRLQIILIRLSPSMHLWWCRLIWNFSRLIWILIKCVYLRKWMKWKINWVNEITFKLDRWWGVTRTRADTNFNFNVVGVNAGWVRRGSLVYSPRKWDVHRPTHRMNEIRDARQDIRKSERNWMISSSYNLTWTHLICGLIDGWLDEEPNWTLVKAVLLFFL